MAKKAEDYLSDSWGRFYLKEGKEVYHVNDIKKEKDKRFVMIVDRVIRSKPRTTEDPSNRGEASRIVGIKCHWYKNGDYVTGMFHTKELVPTDVIDQDSYEDWIKR